MYLYIRKIGGYIMYKLFKRKKNQKGFTLVELVVVIAILGILALIAVPRLSGFTKKAHEAADEQLAQLVANSLQLLIASGDIEVDKETTVYFENSGDKLVYLSENEGLTAVNKTSSQTDASVITVLIQDLIGENTTLSSDSIKIAIPISAEGDINKKAVKLD